MKRSCIRPMTILLLSLSSVTRGDAQLTAELIFPLQGKHVHSSTIEELPNGDLIAAWFYGSGERSADDVQIMGSRLKKGTSKWETPFQMADTPDIPDCNPVLYLDAQERLFLFWIVPHSNRWENSILKYRRADHPIGTGAPDWTWQDIIILKPGDDLPQQIRDGIKQTDLDEGMWAEYAPKYSKLLADAATDPHKRQKGWMGRTRPLTLPSGRILLPLYSDGFNISLVAISDDLGATWRASKAIVGLAPIQPALARRQNGDILAYCRDSGAAPNRVMLSISMDDGESWSVTKDTDIPNPGSSLAMITLSDHRWIMVFNDTERGRHQLAVALSEDEGETWPWKRYLDAADTDRIASFSYPTAIQSKDGTVHVTYSHVIKEGATKTGAAINHVAFDADWIKSREGQGDSP